MEYIENGDLSQYIKRHGSCTTVDVLEITRQLVEGISILHEREICHRDLKPQVRNPCYFAVISKLRSVQNILIASQQPLLVKIADFGVSKYTNGTQLDTRTGTPGYYAPEQIGINWCGGQPRVYTTAVDIWALGCVVHEMLTGEFPFLEPAYTGTQVSGLTADSQYNTMVEAQVDFPALLKFCNGTTEFPTNCLRRSGASDAAVTFLKSLLVPDPDSRLSANDARHSAWLRLEHAAILDPNPDSIPLVSSQSLESNQLAPVEPPTRPRSPFAQMLHWLLPS